MRQSLNIKKKDTVAINGWVLVFEGISHNDITILVM